MPFKTGPNEALGIPAFQPATPDTVAGIAIGTIVKAYDDTQGWGEFIYLPGVASTAIGDAIVYDLAPGAQATVRTLSGTHLNSGRNVAIAMGANVAGTFGWYQIAGVAICNVLAGFIAAQKVFLTATAGNLDDGAIAGCQLLGAVSSSAIGTPAANKAYITLNRPSIQSQIT